MEVGDYPLWIVEVVCVGRSSLVSLTVLLVGVSIRGQVVNGSYDVFETRDGIPLFVGFVDLLIASARVHDNNWDVQMGDV